MVATPHLSNCLKKECKKDFGKSEVFFMLIKDKTILDYLVIAAPTKSTWLLRTYLHRFQEMPEQF